MFRIAMIAGLLTLAIGQNAALVCRVWCDRDAVSNSVCAHAETRAEGAIVTDAGCTLTAETALFIREDGRHGPSALGPAPVLTVAAFQLLPSAAHQVRRIPRAAGALPCACTSHPRASDLAHPPRGTASGPSSISPHFAEPRGHRPRVASTMIRVASGPSKGWFVMTRFTFRPLAIGALALLLFGGTRSHRLRRSSSAHSRCRNWSRAVIRQTMPGSALTSLCSASDMRLKPNGTRQWPGRSWATRTATLGRA